MRVCCLAATLKEPRVYLLSLITPLIHPAGGICAAFGLCLRLSWGEFQVSFWELLRFGPSISPVLHAVFSVWMRLQGALETPAPV